MNEDIEEREEAMDYKGVAMSKQNQEAFDKVAVINHWNINKDSSGNYFSTIVEARYQGWLLSINRIESLDAIATELQVTCDKQSKQLAEMIEAKIFWATRCTEIEGQLEEALSSWRRSAMEASLAHGKIAELQDFAIWMTGCGYDFSALPYFCEQREKLLKGK